MKKLTCLVAMVLTAVSAMAVAALAFAPRAFVQPASTGATGVCCIDDPISCIIATQVECAQQGGIYGGDNTICFLNPFGACTCGPDAGNCLVVHGTPGCELLECCEVICLADPSCCFSEWDAACSNTAAATLTVCDSECRTGDLLDVQLAEGALFGISVAIHGDAAVIGASHFGVPFFDPGAAHIFRFDGATWVHEQKLLAADGVFGDEFGHSVAIDGNTAVVGARSDDDWQGSAFVFRFNGTTWDQQQKLVASDGVLGDRFGRSAAIVGDTIMIGATTDDGAGSTYVFRFDGSSWVQAQELGAADAGQGLGRLFGSSVAMQPGRAVIGAIFDSTNGSSAGAAYVFGFDGSSWIQQQKLLESNGAASHQFGRSVGISGDTIVIGTRTTNSAYTFRFDGASWVQQQQLFASDGAPFDHFGRSVAIAGDIIVVGADEEDPNGVSDAGSAYVFRFDGSTWLEQQKLFAADGTHLDRFGSRVAVDGETGLVGAPNDDNFGNLSGSAYVFTGLADCNANGASDGCDILLGVSADLNGNGVPDECDQPCPVDLDGDGAVAVPDLLTLLAAWGTNPGGPPDFDGDGVVAVPDLLTLLAAWGPCP